MFLASECFFVSVSVSGVKSQLDYLHQCLPGNLLSNKLNFHFLKLASVFFFFFHMAEERGV